MGESSSDSGSDRKRHKSDKKEKKSKKEKKHKKDKKSKHKAEKEPPPSAPGVAAISEADYFEKAAEFRIWLRARGAFLDELDAAEARKLFVKKFVPRWNAGELDPTLYAGVNETAQSAATRTRQSVCGGRPSRRTPSCAVLATRWRASSHSASSAART